MGTSDDDDSETPIIDAITDKVSDLLAKEVESDAETPIIDAIMQNTGESEETILDEVEAELNGDTEDAPLVAAVVEGIIESEIAKVEEQTSEDSVVEEESLLSDLIDSEAENADEEVALDALLEEEVAEAINQQPAAVQDAVDELNDLITLNF